MQRLAMPLLLVFCWSSPGCLLLRWPETDPMETGQDDDTGPTLDPDADNDGYPASQDCDDNDPDEYPGVQWYPDADEDGLGNLTATPTECERAAATDVINNEDCNDGDALLPASDDLDCDEVIASLDCDDTDANSTTLALDRDCDGIATAEDCDDEDSALGAVANDADCDGAITAVDCVDDDEQVGSIADDADCDGLLTAADCNDADTASTAIADDADCDGTLTADDCNDADASSTIRATDGDCDSVLTADDCDDTLASSTVVATDADCDGVLTADDCNDSDDSLLAAANDGDCDGAVTLQDCDDADSSVQSPVDDADCDGSLTEDDCDDANPLVFPGNWDAEGDAFETNCDGSDVVDLGAWATGFYGEEPNDASGYSVASAGDVDGDGLSDVLIGAYLSEDGGIEGGKVYLLFGKNIVAGATIDLANADAVFVGAAGDKAGWSVASAGDVDGDQKDDILIGASGNDGGGVDAGRAYLFFASTIGSGGTFAVAGADATFTGEEAGDRAGHVVSSAGDVNLDNRADLLIASPGHQGSTGKTYLVFGSTIGTGGSFDLSAADASFLGEGGYSADWVATAGDVDDDGRSDILISAPTRGPTVYFGGTVYLFLGSTIAAGGDFNVSSAHAAIRGYEEDSRSGTPAVSAGDVDADGKGDVLIGVSRAKPNGDYSGSTYLILGSTLAAGGEISLANAHASFHGERPGAHSGSSVASAGDVDGDGKADLIIGAYINAEVATHSGKAYLMLGSTVAQGGSYQLDNADAAFLGPGFQSYAGESVAPAGDVNGDGFDDLLIGGSGTSEGGFLAGKTYLLLSPYGRLP